jgi:hypothetical protein
MPLKIVVSSHRVVSGAVQRNRDEQFPGAGEGRRQWHLGGLKPAFGLARGPAVAAIRDLVDRSLFGDEGKNRFRAIGGGPIGVAVDSFCGVFAVSRPS